MTEIKSLLNNLSENTSRFNNTRESLCVETNSTNTRTKKFRWNKHHSTVLKNDEHQDRTKQ